MGNECRECCINRQQSQVVDLLKKEKVACQPTDEAVYPNCDRGIQALQKIGRQGQSGPAQT